MLYAAHHMSSETASRVGLYVDSKLGPTNRYTYRSLTTTSTKPRIYSTIEPICNRLAWRPFNAIFVVRLS